MSNATLTESRYDDKITMPEFYDEDEEYKPVPIFDRYGNPTPETLQAFYEVEHGLVDVMTLDEFKTELDEILASV